MVRCVYIYWWWWLIRLVWSISTTLTLSLARHINDKHGGADCGMVIIIIVVDVQIHEQGKVVSGDGGNGNTYHAGDHVMTDGFGGAVVEDFDGSLILKTDDMTVNRGMRHLRIDQECTRPDNRAGHEQDGRVSEPPDALCVAVECVCVVERVLGNWIVCLIVCGCLWLFVQSVAV